MKWLLVAVAFALGAAITWLLTVKRVTQSVPAGGADVGEVGDPDRGGTGVSSPESPSGEDPVVDDGGATDSAEDDASRFGGERTHASASSSVGWDHDAEDIDALLSDGEKSHAETAGGKTSGEETSAEETAGGKTSGEETSGDETSGHA